ncbi:homeotic protein female sterile-like [Mizuhopecten yessoensis]|uniref:peptidylprolyl isomerase n=1 Tax=Mizuhopecten yessoensis TaxID=6573 RepID=A0A210PJG5_MIZYE|nr:homeotic protein female sterile-like [Mizuhopecten yessoensis]OWF36624.1 FK506-binding protein 2B [Mizuhopecten yessoensis]
MNAGKLLILLIFIMVLVWYTAIWTIVIKRVKADTELSDLTMETVQNGGDCLRKSQADDRLLVHYVIKIHGTDNVIESRTNEDSPYIVHLGQFVDIPTLERGLFDMCEQESRSMVVPPLLGYGVKDSQTKQGNLVPGNSTLQYDVTLVKIFSKEESKTNKDTINEVKPTEGQEGTERGVESAGASETADQTTDPTEDTTPSEEDAVKAKDKKIVENIMEDAMNAVFPDQKDSGGLAGMIGGMLGGGGGGGGMAGLVGQLAGAMGKGGADGGGEGMAGLMGQLAGAMGKGGTDGGGEGMAGLVSKLAGAMGGEGTGAEGMEGLMGQLAGAIGKGGEGGMEGLMGKLSGLMGGGDGGKGGMEGLMGLMGQLGGENGLPLGKINDAISNMMKKQKERRNRRKTEL